MHLLALPDKVGETQVKHLLEPQTITSNNNEKEKKEKKEKKI